MATGPQQASTLDLCRHGGELAISASHPSLYGKLTDHGQDRFQPSAMSPDVPEERASQSLSPTVLLP